MSKTIEAKAGLPAVLRPVNHNTSLTKSAPAPQFLAQLIAARDRLPVQRRYRQAEPGQVDASYREGSDRGEPRLKPGFFADRPV